MDGGAIGNAAWTGAALSDIRDAAGADRDPLLHVAFEALDIASNEGAADAPYGVSIPMSKAGCADVLLAWAMNGDPLTRDHGAPLRTVVPGYAGVRSVKWLRSIAVQERPSDAFQQAHDYHLIPPGMEDDASTGSVINEMPLTAAICVPSEGCSVPAGRLVLRGYAVATDRAVARVELTRDEGRTWVQATLEDHGAARWSWTFWHAALDLPPGRHELCVRAWDAAGQTQPARPEETWNCKGYLNTAWHRIEVRAE